MDFKIIDANNEALMLHNVNFARYDQRNHEFVFIGNRKEDTVRIPQERIISISLCNTESEEDDGKKA